MKRRGIFAALGIVVVAPRAFGQAVTGSNAKDASAGVPGTAARREDDAAVVRIGVAIATSGANLPRATDYRRGIDLWHERLATAGGIAGRRVELVIVDDASDAARVAGLYERLVREERVSVLFAPFGSAATAAASGVAERHAQVMLSATATAQVVRKRERVWTFHVALSNDRLGAGLEALVRGAGLGSIFVLAREDLTSREAATGMVSRARDAGLRALEPVFYGVGARDFTQLVANGQASGAEAWVGFGGARDAAAIVSAMKTAGHAPGLLVLQGAVEPEFVSRLGQDAEQVIGVAAYHEAAAGTENATFASVYRSRWKSAPPLAAAQGYSAGRVIEAAIIRAGSLQPEALRKALDELDVETPLGRYGIDPQSGAQIGMRAVITQIQRGRIVPVSPEGVARATVLLPFPPWAGRTTIR